MNRLYAKVHESPVFSNYAGRGKLLLSGRVPLFDVIIVHTHSPQVQNYKTWPSGVETLELCGRPY